MGEERSASAVPLSPAAGTPLIPTQFRALSEFPLEIERFVGIDSPQTRHTYQNGLREQLLSLLFYRTLVRRSC